MGPARQEPRPPGSRGSVERQSTPTGASAVVSALPTPLPQPAHGLPVVVVVVLSGVSLADLAEAPTTAIRGLMTSGAVGLMNARTAPATPGRLRRAIDSLVLHPEEIRPTTLEAGCLTLGAGTRTFARAEAGEAFDAEEGHLGLPAASWWSQRTGHTPRDDRVYQISIPRLSALQAALAYPATPGILGDALRLAGMPAAVVGNADDETGPHREAACIAMDTLGRVPLGSVGASLSSPDALSPGGRRTDPDAVVRASEAAIRDGARLLVVDAGDTARVERAGEGIQSALRPRRRREAIQRADRILSGLLRRVDATRALLLLVAPAPSLDAARAGDALTPVVMAGRGVERGLLSSPSTRTPGLATNTDIAPTILRFLQVPAPAQLVGRPLTSVHDTQAVDHLLALQARFRRIDDTARPVMRWLVWVQIALLGAFILFAWVRPDSEALRSPVTGIGALALVALPAALLLAGAVSAPTAPLAMAAVVALDAALVASAHALRRFASPAGILFAVAAGVFLGDTLTGCGLLRASPLGYSPYAGARYYGIGNEGFGCLLASLLLAVAFLWPKQRPSRTSHPLTPSPLHPFTPSRVQVPLLAASLLMLAAAILIGHPAVGANFGGALSAAAACAAAAAFALQGRLSRRGLFGLLAAAVAVAALPALFDLLAGGDRQSHIGRAVESIRTEGLGAAWGIASRKLAMNFLLLRRSPWSRLLLLAGLVLVYATGRRGREMREQAPVEWAAVRATLIGAAAAFLVNDSGVLPAAEMVVAATAAVLLCARELPKEGTADAATGDPEGGA